MARKTLVPLLLTLAPLLGAGCGAHTSAAYEQAVRAADGSLRLESPAGSFATWNETFPPELEAAVRGETPAIEVWALEDDSLEHPSQLRR